MGFHAVDLGLKPNIAVTSAQKSVISVHAHEAQAVVDAVASALQIRRQLELGLSERRQRRREAVMKEIEAAQDFAKLAFAGDWLLPKGARLRLRPLSLVESQHGNHNVSLDVLCGACVGPEGARGFKARPPSYYVKLGESGSQFEVWTNHYD